MADAKTTQLTALTATPAVGDQLMIVDVSDTTMAASGTNKKLAASYLARSDAGAKLITGSGLELTVPATGTAALIASGTWTPALSPSGGGTPTYTAQVGRYATLADATNRWCLASFNILVSNKGTMSGNLTMNLPVAVANIANLYIPTVLLITYYSGGGYVVAYPNINTITASLLKVGLNADSDWVTAATIGNGTNISGTIIYPCQ